jgi:D-glycero-D-manno-heptose 1,7-bisphosphate phosphatase
MNLKDFNIGLEWTLFLDRDGTINEKFDGDYVKDWKQFKFLAGAIEALKSLNRIFGRTIIVTNQSGIGKGRMKEEDLHLIHQNMLRVLKMQGVHIDKIYYCPHNYEIENCNCRKPNIGMALNAKNDFHDIDFSKSVMVGDSLSDMMFGRTLGMITVFINSESKPTTESIYYIDLQYKSLIEFANELLKTDCGIKKAYR